MNSNIIDDTQQIQLPNGFHYSAAPIDTLGSSEYTIVSIVVDKSGSVSPFKQLLEDLLKNSIKACRKDPRADNLLARVITFGSQTDELHGFKLLTNINDDDYQGQINPGGCTKLNDTALHVFESMKAEGNRLNDNRFSTNGIVIFVTDGEDVGSSNGVNSVKKAYDELKRSESLESIMTILIGVNIDDGHVKKSLEDWKDAIGIDQFVSAKDASPSTLAKIQGHISKSISNQSAALGTGGPSQTITF